MLNQYHPRAPLKSIFVQNDPKPYCHFVILSRLLFPDLVGLAKAMQWRCQRWSLTEIRDRQ